MVCTKVIKCNYLSIELRSRKKILIESKGMFYHCNYESVNSKFK